MNNVLSWCDVAEKAMRSHLEVSKIGQNKFILTIKIAFDFNERLTALKSKGAVTSLTLIFILYT